jgi:hypothetical protein
MRLKDFASFFRQDDFDAMTTAYNEARKCDVRKVAIRSVP